MAVRRVQLRRGTTNQNNAFRGVEGEITVDTETKSIRVHDGNNDGGFDLMRADMSNDNFAADDITIAEGVGANTLTIGHSTSTVAIAGNLTVAGNVTQSDSLAIAARLIGINTGANQTALDTDSIGIIFERFNSDGQAGAGTEQDNAFLVWRETGDYFVFGTAPNIDESYENDLFRDGQTQGVDWEYTDVYLKTLYADAGLDAGDGNITSVGQIQADSLRYSDANAKLAIIPEAGLAQADAFSINDGAKTYLTINTSTEDIVFGTVAKKLTINSNDIDLGTDAANDVVIEVAARTGDNDGSDLTIRAGSAANSDNNLGGNLILASGSGVQNSVEGIGGTSSIQFQTKRDTVAGVTEAMRIHIDGNVGIGDNAPGTLLQLSGENAYLTLKNTTAENTNRGAETKIIFEDHGNNALGQIEVSHQGTDDDEFGQMIFSTNNDGGLQTALTINKDQKATFAGDVVVEGRDLVLGTATGGNTSITVPAQTVVDDDGHSLSIEAGSANGDGTSGSLTLKTYDATETLKTALTIDTNQDIILGQDGDTNVNISLPTDSDGAGASLTISAAVGNNAGTNDGSLILRSGTQNVLTLDTAQKATFAGAVEVTTTLDMTDGNINNVATLYLDDIQCHDGADVFSLTAKNDTEDAISIVDADARSYLSVDARDTNGNVPNLILGQPTNLSSTLAVTGLANLNAGIEIDNAGNGTNEFTVAHTSGNVLTKGTITSHGNHTVGVAGQGNPNLSVVNNANTTTFSVTGETGATTIAGTAGITGITTLDDTLKIKSAPTGGNAIIINSDRGAVAKGGANTDVSILFVEGGDNGTDAYLKWNDSLDSFTVTGGKFNTEEQFSVGPIATPNFKVTKTTGLLDVLGTAPVLTLKNSTAGDGDNADPILIKFQNDGGEEHGRITASQDGGTKNDGKIVFSTGNHAAGPAVQTVLTLDHDKDATFAGNVTVSGNTIDFGNTASIVNGAADTLTITEDNIKFAGITHITAGAASPAILYMSADNSDDNADDWRLQATDGNLFSIASFISGGYQDFFSVVGNANTLLSTTTVEGKLVVKGESISGVENGDLAIASDGSLIFHIDADNDAADKLFSFKVNGIVGAGTEVAQIDESGNLQIDGDLTLGGDHINSNDGTPTIELAADGTDTTINKVLSVVGNGAGTLSIDLGANDGNDSVVQVLGRSGGNNLEGNKLILKGGGSTGSGNGGSIEFHTAAAGGGGADARNPALALAIASDKSATFEGAVTIKGNLDIQGTGSLTTIDTTNLSVSDKVIELASGADDAVIDNTTNDVGLVFTRGRTVGNDAGTTQDPAVFFWDEEFNKFVLATKSGASTSTVDFSNGGFTEAQLDVGTLNADIITIDDADATSLVIKEAGNSYLTFNTDGEQVEFGKIFTAITGSKIGNLTLGDGSITDSGGTINLGTNIEFTGNLTINTDKFAVAGATGIITLENGATIDNNTTATDLIITENNVVFPSGSLILGAETDDGSTYTIAGRTTVVDGDNGNAHRAGGDLVLRGAVGSNAGTNDGSVYIDSGAGRVASFEIANLKTTLHGAVEIGTSLDMTGGPITQVTDIALDSITADDANTITVNIKQAGGASAFVIKDNDANEIEHIKINATDGGDKTTIGSASLDISGATSIDNSVTINNSHAAVDFRVASDNLEYAIFVDGDADKIGIGESAPGTLLQVSGTRAQLPYITLKNTTDEHGNGEAATKIIFEDHGDNPLGQIEVSHQGTDNNAFGQLILSTNDNDGLEPALVIDKDQVATFKQDVVIEGGSNAAVLTLGKNQGQDSEITVAARTGDNDGQNLTISAGDADNSNDNLGGDLILASGNGVTNGGTSTIQFQTKVTGTAGVSEAMRIHSNGYLGIGDNAPETILHLKGSTTATTTLTLESSADVDQNAQDEGATILAFKGADALAFAQIVGAHDGTGDDDKGTLIFKTNNNAALTEALRIDSNQNSTFAGNVTIKNDADSANAVLSLISDRGDEVGDTWTLDAADETATLTINNNVSGGSVAQLTLLGDAVATDGRATFAGKVTVSGNELDFAAGAATVGASVGNQNLTLGGGTSTVVIPGDLKVATLKSLTLNNGVANAAANVDAYIYASRGTDADVAIRWDEGDNRWMHTNDGTNYYNILNANDTLLTVTTDSGGGSAHTTTQASNGVSILGAANEIDVTNDNGTITVGIKTDPTLTGEVTITGNIVGNGNHVLFKDRMIFLAKGNDNPTRDLGFFGQYSDDQEADPTHFTGFIYQPVAGDGGKNGVYKLFHGIATDLSTGLTNDITVADSELATVDVSQIRGGSKLGVGDDQAGADLTISGGAPTGDGAGGSILFKVAPASQGAGATERLPTTTALTIASTKLATFAGNATVSGGTITVGSDGATITGTTDGSNVLTLTESTVATSAALTVGTTLTASGDVTVRSASGQNANLYLVADNSEDNIDTWRVQAPDASRTLAFGNQNAAGNATVDVLTLTGHDTGTSSTATFAGNVTVSGNTLEFGNGATIVNGGADTLTITEDTVEFSAAVTVGTTLTASGAITAPSATLLAANDANATLVFKSDNGDDAGDEWEIKAEANTNKLYIGNDLANAGTYASILTLTGHATVTSTDATFAGNVNVQGGGLTITKTTGKTVDEDENEDNAIQTVNEKSFQITVTTHNAVADDAHSADFTINSNSVSSTSVIMATCQSAHNVQVYAHTLVNATSFKFAFVNRTGNPIAQDTDLVINFVII